MRVFEIEQTHHHKMRNRISSTPLYCQWIVNGKRPAKATIAMPYTLLQTLNYLAATNRAYFASEHLRSQHVNMQKPGRRTHCRLVTCHRKADRGRRLLVFKTTGPGKKVGGLRNLPCGQGSCWVCGKLLGKWAVLIITFAWL
jgi:hypothetical protein